MRSNVDYLFANALALALAASASMQAQSSSRPGPPEIAIHLPNPYRGVGLWAGPAAGDDRGNSQGRGKPKPPPPSPNGIDYHGGPVMVNPVNIYYIWYGSWDNNSITILEDFARHIGGSPYYNINTTYFDGAGNRVQNSVVFAGSITDNYSRGSVALSNSDISSIVANAISSGLLGPPDPDGVYFVLTSADVTKSGFCTSYCGWHTYGTYVTGGRGRNRTGVDIKYSFVGNAEVQCPHACTIQATSSPNDNIGADGMASVIAHELEEAATDPDLNAWWDDSNGQENADKCAWTFGTVYNAANGSFANMNLGGRDYMIQRNWVNAGGGYCALSYP